MFFIFSLDFYPIYPTNKLHLLSSLNPITSTVKYNNICFSLEFVWHMFGVQNVVNNNKNSSNNSNSFPSQPHSFFFFWTSCGFQKTQTFSDFIVHCPLFSLASFIVITLDFLEKTDLIIIKGFLPVVLVTVLNHSTHTTSWLSGKLHLNSH